MIWNTSYILYIWLIICLILKLHISCDTSNWLNLIFSFKKARNFDFLYLGGLTRAYSTSWKILDWFQNYFKVMEENLRWSYACFFRYFIKREFQYLKFMRFIIFFLYSLLNCLAVIFPFTGTTRISRSIFTRKFYISVTLASLNVYICKPYQTLHVNPI